MSEVEQITDYVERGPASLSERYRKPTIVALLRSWLSEVQEVENAFWQLLTERSVANAVGAQLDVLGRLVDQPREGRSDEIYRIWVSAKVRVLRASGLAEELVAIAKHLLPDVPIFLEEYYPLAMMMRAETPIDPTLGTQIAKFLAAAKGGGVALQFEWFAAGMDQPLMLGSEPEYDSPYGLGNGVLAAVSNGNHVVFTDPGLPENVLEFDAGYEPLVYDEDGDYLILG